MQGNGWSLDVLIHSRRIAGRWLKRKVDDFDGEAANELRVAADCYARLAESCAKDLDSSWELAPGPDHAESWTSALRQEQIARLEGARVNDRAAIAAIEKALESMK